MYELKKSAQLILRRMEKAGSNTYDGLTADAPTNVIDMNKPLQEKEFFDQEAEFFGDKIELSKRLMNVDNNFYGVRDDVAYKLLDYIESRDFDCVLDLEIELGDKKRILKEKSQGIGEVDLNDFLAEIDYMRAVNHRKEEIKEFQSKIKYIELLIKIIEEYAEEKKEKKQEFAVENEDWAIIQHTASNSPTDAGRLR